MGVAEVAEQPAASETRLEREAENRKSLRAAGIMALIFLAVLAVSWEVYPARGDLERPPTIFMNLESTTSGPSLFTSGLSAPSQAPHLTAMVPEPAGYTIAYGNTVALTLDQQANNRLGVTLDWTYLPKECGAHSQGDASCVRSFTPPPSAEVTLFLPADATVLVPSQRQVVFSTASGQSGGCSVANHCLQQTQYAGRELAIFQSVLNGSYGSVDQSSTLSATIHWTFTVALHEPYFEQNGENALTQLPGVQILNPIDHDAFVNVKTTYQVPGFDHYVWGQGPSPSGNIWNVPLDQEHSTIAVGGVDNHAVSQDTLFVFASGALLGIAGAALIESIHELAGRDGLLRWLQRPRQGGRDGPPAPPSSNEV